MSGKICDASNSVALDFDIRAEHLPNQWLETTQFYDKKLVIGFSWIEGEMNGDPIRKNVSMIAYYSPPDFPEQR